MSAREAVARGVALLDEHMPGWELKIDVGTLDMGDCDVCVLGQLVGEYTEGLHQLGIYDRWFAPEEGVVTALYSEEAGYFEEAVPACTWYGFEGAWSHLERNYAALEQEWARVIKKRLDRGVDLG
jgi:hypothetical protein